MASKHPEAMLISAMLETGDHITAPARGITPQMFHVHRDEWKFLFGYIKRRRRIPSRAAFSAKFPNFKIQKVDDVEHFTDEVKQTHIKHSLITILDESAEGLTTSMDMNEVLSSLHSDVLNLQSDVLGQTGDSDIIVNWKDIYQDVSERVLRVEEKGMAGIPTGFDTLDEKTGGVQPGEYWVIAARLGQGKTWTGIRMATTAAYAGYSVQYFSLEMTRTQMALRAHTFMSSKYGKEVFRHMDLKDGKNFELSHYRKFLRSLKKHLPGRFYVDDSSSGKVSPLTIAAKIEKNKPDIVFIDYLTLMDKDSEGWDAIASLSSEIKQICQRYNMPVVVLAQINRAGISQNSPPSTEHISQSDKIGQDADAVVTLTKRSERVIQFRLAKYRHGQDQGTWYTEFKPNTGMFTEVSGNDAYDLMEADAEQDES